MTNTSESRAPMPLLTPWRSNQLVIELQMNPTIAPTERQMTAELTRPRTARMMANVMAQPMNAHARTATSLAER